MSIILFREKGNEYDLAKKIKQLFSDINFYNQVTSSCIERAKQYDIKNMAKKYEEIYFEVLKLS